ncbi:uncharacterized protein N7515_000726 [Penicillium bovifimosum]|uniref:Uncharacterized protein n=1 Tax=Penicillium bovifimosum TaxID=126998 RepID=A0A9W9HIR4_9EURO|nr:uncharacterized protein N7515_000726 [Penicillium bovifimosum]KAJ5146162.1 hypothetical protein N7515_000726 [Penicillium bovifimosum]
MSFSWDWHRFRGENCHSVLTSLTPVSRLLTHITRTHPRVSQRRLVRLSERKALFSTPYGRMY